MKIQLLIFLLLFSITLSNCKKDNDNTPDLLTTKIWRRGIKDKNVSTNPPGEVFYYPIKTCEKDDRFKFGSNGQLTIKNGKNKCDPDELSKETQPYKINLKTHTLTINGVSYILAEESKDQIKYYAPTPSVTGHAYLVFLLQ